MSKWRIAGVSFEHFHMGDNLRTVFDHPDAEIVGICDEEPERMQDAIRNFGIPDDRVFTDYRRCLETAKPDIVIMCPAAATHGEWTGKVAPFGAHIIMEKPFAGSLAEADAMVEAMKPTGKRLVINWPMAWSAPHRTAKRLIDDGLIGEVIEVHSYGGNRGPLFHTADKVERTAEDVAREKPNSWFYKKDRGGGSMLDYLGYGTTGATWLNGGKKPVEVTAVVDEPAGLEVDEQSVTVARYEKGLSSFQTRWGTFTDPWTHQPQPKCGFVVVGTEGTIGLYGGERTVRVQTRECPEGREVPVDELEPPHQNTVQYVIDCLEKDRPVEGMLSLPTSRTGQRIIDSAVLSAREKRTVPLVG